MKARVRTVDRRDALKWIVGGTALTAASVGVISELLKRRPLPRIFELERRVGETALPIPEYWSRALDRVSIESLPLDKGRLDTLPMRPVDDKGYCKSGALVEAQKYGLTIPDVYDELGMDFGSTGGRIMARATDWYAVVPADPGKTYFSVSKDNLPKEYWSADGLERARRIRATPYGTFISAGAEARHAWKDLVDVCGIAALKGETEAGAYFLGPDGDIVKTENFDIGMSSLGRLVLTLIAESARTQVPYSKIKRICEKNRMPYKNRGELPAIPVKKLFELEGLDCRGKALLLYANNYSVSVPPWRQEALVVLFDERYSSFGAPTKLIGRDLNKAGQINGFYRIEAVSI